MSLPSHASFKDSWVEWVGPVPSYWTVKRLRFVAEINPSKSEVSHLPADTEVSFVPMEAIGEDGSLDLARVQPLADVQAGYTFFRDGDVTIAKITPCFENGKGAIMRGLCNGIGFGTTELIVARPKHSQTTSTYLKWIFTSRPFRKAGEAFMYGAGGQKRVPDNFVRDFAIAFPPLQEQHHIAAFLDRETSKIDTLVDEQKHLIELLKEKRAAVISHAVAKGLDPNVPMKDSGVEWLGKVPAHWNVVRVKDVARLESGHTPSKTVVEYWENCTIPWVSLNDSKQLASSDYITETAVQINELGLANSSARMIPSGAVVFTRDATVGLAAITTRPMAVSQHLIAWCPSEDIDALYLLRVFDVMKSFLDSTTFGATIKTIGMADLKKLVMPVPPRAEQLKIAAVVGRSINSIDALVRDAEVSIDLLRERRAALISAAVTGKVDVRGLVPHPASAVA